MYFEQSLTKSNAPRLQVHVFDPNAPNGIITCLRKCLQRPQIMHCLHFLQFCRILHKCAFNGNSREIHNKRMAAQQKVGFFLS